MNLSLVMIQGEFGAQVPELLSHFDHHCVALHEETVPGVETGRRVDQMRSAAGGRHEIVRVAQDQGWTVLADDQGMLAESMSACATLARVLDTQVITALDDGELWAFSIHGPDGLRRALVVDGDDVVARGAPLPIEQLFSGRAELRDLTMLIQSFGLDFERLNLEASYRLATVEPHAA